MDRELPFSFLDHKVKCGNGLIGAWFDTFQHYPVMAWKNREAGDENHTNGHHLPKENRAKLLKEWSRNQLLGDTRIFLQGKTLFSESHTRQAEAVHAHALSVLQTLHELPIHDSGARAAVYKKELLESDAYRSLKQALDLWCSIWFWPVEELSLAPIPSDLARPSEETLRVSNDIARTKRFLHWELEFPDVFRKQGDGFDAIIGNPPWETAKPNSKEFFSNEDPLYRTYGKQEAIQQQTKIFQDHPDVEHRWVNYLADLKAQSNFMGYAATPFGDPEAASEPLSRFTIIRGGENEVLHLRWRNVRSRTAGFADPQHAFRYQGKGDVNLYKLFLEQGQALLREGGRMGVIVPSGIYSDLGSQPLRERFLDQGQWEWLFGFENRNKVFDIDSRFKFNPVIVQKGGRTERILTAFMRRNLEDWENAEKYVAPYRREQVVQFSPKSKSLLEIQSPEDLAILEKIYSHSVLLGDQGPEGWGVKYATEFHMTNDSKLFPPRPKWEAEGYKPDEYSRWLKGNWQPIAELWDALGVTFPEGFTSRSAQPPYDKIPIPRKDIPAGIIISRFADEWIREEEIEDVSLPLYEGKMIWIQKWAYDENNISESKSFSFLNPNYLLSSSNYNLKSSCTPKVTIRDIARSTDKRTFISCVIPQFPCGHLVGILNPDRKFSNKISHLSNALSSIVSDWVIRLKLTGTHMSWHIIEMHPIPINLARFHHGIFHSTSFPDTVFSPERLRHTELSKSPYSLSQFEGLRKKVMIEVVISHLYRIDYSDLLLIMLDCDLRIGISGNNPKGFWRVDKDKDPELRQTVLTIVAFHDLQKHIEACGGDREKGLDSFLNQNNGEGWMIPETLRLADYGLGHDDRALEHQPVASRLGPRYYDWQLAQTPEESWAECHVHARNLLGKEAYDRLIHRIENGLPLEDEEESSPTAEPGSAPPKKRGRKPKSNNPPPPTLF
jgi:hypothetical protein